MSAFPDWFPIWIEKVPLNRTIPFRDPGQAIYKTFSKYGMNSTTAKI
jgi:hypothetical protein